MKTRLTKEESAHLISLGVPKDKASITYIEEIRIVNNREVYDWAYHFSLTDLLEILPKEIVYQELKYQIRIEWDEEWDVDYVEDGYSSVITAKSEELIDALYKLCVWYLENKHKILKS